MIVVPIHKILEVESECSILKKNVQGVETKVQTLPICVFFFCEIKVLD